jgi:hypothetical protein
MTNKELATLIEPKLATFNWELYSDHELRTYHEGFSLYLNDQGRIQVFKGGVELVQFNVTFAATDELIEQAKQKALDEFAACFAPAQAPAVEKKRQFLGVDDGQPRTNTFYGKVPEA